MSSNEKDYLHFWIDSSSYELMSEYFNQAENVSSLMNSIECALCMISLKEQYFFRLETSFNIRVPF